MNVLIFGSTSSIGQSITNIFAEKNNLILAGRSKHKLEKIKKNAILNGALSINIIEYDLATDINYFIKNIKNVEMDLVINLASSTSGLRDDNVKSNIIRSDLNADLINPILLIQWLIDKGNKFNIIFLSSILSKINSPNRVIYSSFKSLQETYLNKIATDHFSKVNLLTVTLGTEIKKNRESKKSLKLAQKIFNAYTKGEKTLFFGFFGRVLWFTYYLNPAFFKLIVYLKRKIILLDKNN